MKVWMWQRLWKYNGRERVCSELGVTECHEEFKRNPSYGHWHWLCPKPNLVLVDRKHLGGME